MASPAGVLGRKEIRDREGLAWHSQELVAAAQGHKPDIGTLA